MEDQPMPHEGQQDVTPQIVQLLYQRQAKGIATYGRPLQTFNGRDALWDALEEAIDLVQYLAQVILERDGHL